MQKINDENTLCDTHAIGGSVVTRIQYRATEEDVAPDVQHYASRDPHGNISFLANDDESEWLHRCDAYQMHENGFLSHLNKVLYSKITWTQYKRSKQCMMMMTRSVGFLVV